MACHIANSVAAGCEAILEGAGAAIISEEAFVGNSISPLLEVLRRQPHGRTFRLSCSRSVDGSHSRVSAYGSSAGLWEISSCLSGRFVPRLCLARWRSPSEVDRGNIRSAIKSNSTRSPRRPCFDLRSWRLQDVLPPASRTRSIIRWRPSLIFSTLCTAICRRSNANNTLQTPNRN